MQGLRRSNGSRQEFSAPSGAGVDGRLQCTSIYWNRRRAVVAVLIGVDADYSRETHQVRHRSGTDRVLPWPLAGLPDGPDSTPAVADLGEPLRVRATGQTRAGMGGLPGFRAPLREDVALSILAGGFPGSRSGGITVAALTLDERERMRYRSPVPAQGLRE